MLNHPAPVRAAVIDTPSGLLCAHVRTLTGLWPGELVVVEAAGRTAVCFSPQDDNDARERVLARQG